MVAVPSTMTLINMVATSCNPHDLAVSKIQDIPPTSLSMLQVAAVSKIQDIPPTSLYMLQVGTFQHVSSLS